MGGFVAMTIAAHYPEAVSRIVLTDTTSGGRGFSSASTALRAKLSQFTEQPVPPDIFYPDTTAGRIGLYRYNSFQSGTYNSFDLSWAYILSNSVYDQLPNVTSVPLSLLGR